MSGISVGRESRFHRLTGLRIVPQRPFAATLAVAACLVAVSGWVILLDAVLFRSHVRPEYLASLQGPLGAHVALYAILAAVEEVKVRLVLMTLLAALAVRLRGRLAAGAAIAIILAAQLASVGALVIDDPLYAALRFWLVGSVWGWLYWRHGWLAALAGHVLAHPVLDPLLRLALAA